MTLENKKVLVKDVPSRTNSEIIRKVFSQFGAVEKVELSFPKDIVDSNGTALITFENSLIVSKLVEQEHLQIDNKRVRIQKPPLNENVEYETDTNQELKIYARGFLADTTQQEILTIFEQFGPVFQIIMPHKNNGKIFRGFAYVVMKDKESYDKAIQAKKIKYNELTVKIKPAILSTDLAEIKKNKRLQRKEAKKKKQLEAALLKKKTSSNKCELQPSPHKILEDKEEILAQDYESFFDKSLLPELGYRGKYLRKVNIYPLKRKFIAQQFLNRLNNQEHNLILKPRSRLYDQANNFWKYKIPQLETSLSFPINGFRFNLFYNLESKLSAAEIAGTHRIGRQE